MIIHVKVVPNAKKSEIIGKHGTYYRVRIAAPAVEGKANAALSEFFAETFDVKKRDVSLLRGQKGRMKTIDIKGITEKDCEIVWAKAQKR